MHKDIAEAHSVGQRPFKRLRSWPSSLNLLTISAILVPLAFFALGAVASWRAVNAEARSGIERTTDLLHEHALRSFETHEAVLTAVDQRILGMSWSDIRENTDVAAFLTALVKSAGPLAGILVADPDDKVAAASFALPQTPIDLSPLDFVRPRQADGAKSYVGPLIRQRADGTVTFPVARRRTTLEDHYDGMIASFLSPAYFETFYQHLNNRSGDLIALIRDDGTILAHSPHLPANDEIGAASQQRNPGISASDGAILVRSPLDGIERYISTRRVGDYPVFVRHGRSLRSVQEQWLTRFAPFGLLCLAAMGLLSLLTWRTSVATARERDARARLAVEEARHAADAENTARVSRLMETNVFGVTSCSTDGIIEANDAFLKMVDLTRDQFEANGFDWKAATVGADIAMEAHAQAEIMANGACRPYEREFLLPSGKTVPVMIGATLYERQPLVWICFLLDLTERREREAQQLFVMRELNHRTKNLLTVIRSIAGQIARTGRDWSDFNERFSNRLSALGDSHDLLVESNWRGVTMSDLVHSQFRQFEDLTGGQIVTSGEPLMLSPRAAQAIGMALYELSTNAVKYGALSVADGRIEIGWRRFDGPDDEQHFAMHWRESGGPPVVEPERQGFGHVVIAKMTARALRGHVTYSFPPTGLEWTLEAPLDSVEEQPDVPFMAKI